jgi:hypothetical protein
MGCIALYFRQFLRLFSREYGGPKKGHCRHRDWLGVVYSGRPSMSDASNPSKSSSLVLLSLLENFLMSSSVIPVGVFVAVVIEHLKLHC